MVADLFNIQQRHLLAWPTTLFNDFFREITSTNKFHPFAKFRFNKLIDFAQVSDNKLIQIFSQLSVGQIDNPYTTSLCIIVICIIIDFPVIPTAFCDSRFPVFANLNPAI